MTPAALVVSILSLGCALQVNFGQYHPLALAWLAASLLACTMAVVLPNAGTLRVRGLRPDLLLACLALAFQFFLLLTSNPTATGPADRLLPFRVGVLCAISFVALAVFATKRWRLLGIGFMLLAHLYLGAWTLLTTPHPRVDVYVFQEQACQALVQGQNPYTITYPDLNPAASERFYAPGVSVEGRLQFGYPYPPLTLLLALPAHLLAGDFRWAQLIATTLAGGLIAFTRPGRMPVLAAALLLFTPRGFFVLEAGWTEPFVVLVLAATVFFACRPGFARGFALPVALGLFLASKQYLVLVIPLLPLLWKSLAAAPLRTQFEISNLRSQIRTDPARGLLIASACAALVTLPLALWNLPAFLHSAITLQFHQPFRPDALSLLVPLSAAIGRAPPAWIGFVLLPPAIALALWRCPRSPSGFALAVAFTFLAFFAFNKQAFCNYYSFILAGLCCALATLPLTPAPEHRSQPY